MREITSHKVNQANEKIKIEVLDDPGDGGANHRYDITGYDSKGNPSSVGPDGYECSHARTVILFQNGPIPESGVNGITNETLLAIVRDRMQGFQSGPFACRENALALTKIEEAIHWLHHRTNDRIARGVEGTHER